MTVSLALPNAHAALIGHYTFDGNADDSSGNGYNGTEIGGTSYSQGVFSQAALFDGNDGNISVLHKFTRLSEFTLAAWVNLDAQGSSHGLIQTGSGDITYDPSQDTFDLSIYHDRNGGADSPIGFASTRTNYNFVTAGIEEIWAHIALVGFADNTASFFLNGVSISIAPAMIDGGVTGKYDSTVVGARHDNRTGQAFDFYSGLIDDVRIYDNALREADVRDLYNSRSVPAPPGFALLSVGLSALLIARRRKNIA
jgi:hypothetical protein